MLTIGIDGNEANIKNRVGVNVYAYEILKNLQLLQGRRKNDFKVVVYLKENPLPDMPQVTTFWEYKVLPTSKPFWILTRLMPFIYKQKNKPDVMFTPSHYVMPFSPIPRVASIMDLGYLNFSGQFEKKVFWQLKYWTAISILASKKVIAISYATKDDIVRHYPFASRKTNVTLLGYDTQKYNAHISIDDVRRIKKKYSIVDDYILYIGTLKPSKNIEGIVEAFSIIKKINRNIKLVIAGKKGWLYDSIFEKVKKLGLQSDVVFTDFIPDEEKPALMKGAKLLISPSYWEGFGLHAVESMACGVPVVVSSVGSFPEVVGKAGILVNPNSVEDIAKGAIKVLEMSKMEYNKVVNEGLKEVQKFSWSNAAQETFNILKEAAGK